MLDEDFEKFKEENTITFRLLGTDYSIVKNQEELEFYDESNYINENASAINSMLYDYFRETYDIDYYEKIVDHYKNPEYNDLPDENEKDLGKKQIGVFFSLINLLEDIEKCFGEKLFIEIFASTKYDWSNNVSAFISSWNTNFVDINYDFIEIPEDYFERECGDFDSLNRWIDKYTQLTQKEGTKQ